MSTIQGIIFDRDDTLLYFHLGKLLGIYLRLMWVAPRFKWGDLTRYWDNEMPLEILPKRVEDEPAFWQTFWFEICRDRYQLDPKTAHRLLPIVRQYARIFAAYPDTRPTLALLHAKNYKMGILTNFELPSIASTLQATGVPPEWFVEAALLNRSMVGNTKPHPQGYQMAAERLGLETSAVAFVDDDPNNVAPACELGMRGILLDRKKKYVQETFPHPVIYTLKELPAVLER